MALHLDQDGQLIPLTRDHLKDGPLQGTIEGYSGGDSNKQLGWTFIAADGRRFIHPYLDMYMAIRKRAVTTQVKAKAHLADGDIDFKIER